MNHSGQSALEYIATYGWVLIIIVVIAAALFMLGVLDPRTYTAESGTGFSHLGYIDHTVGNDRLSLILANGEGERIIITNVTVSFDDWDSNYSTNLSEAVQPNEQAQLNATIDSPEGAYSGDAIITYQTKNGLTKHQRGKITGTAIIPVVGTGTYSFNVAPDYSYSSDISVSAGQAYLTQSSNWYHQNWKYRAPITNTNIGNPTALTNFQVDSGINTQSLISAGKMKADCGDLRFTNNLGNEINYWRLDDCNLATTTYWSKVPTLSGGGSTTTYLYYGNNAATEGSSYDTTMQKIDSDDTGLASLWHFDEGSGQVIGDATTNNNDGFRGNNNNAESQDPLWNTIDGGRWDSQDYTFTSGAKLNFDGSNDYVRVADDNSLDLTANGTVMAWIYSPSIGSWDGIVHKGQLGDFSDEAYSLQFKTNRRLSAFLNNAGGSYQYVQGSAQLSTNAWHHVALTWDANNIKLYLDGTQDVSVSNTIGNVRNTAGDLLIGCQTTATNYCFKGYIDEVATYNKTLSANEITTKYERRKYANPEPTTSLGSEETQYATYSIITPNASITPSSVTSWDSFEVTKTLNGQSIEYQLSDNDGLTWKYWNGTAWAVTVNSWNDETTVNSNISSFSTTSGKIMVRIKLNSDYTNTPHIDNIAINYTK